MKEVVLITGAGGMLAQELSRKLDSKYNIRFLTRKKHHNNDYEWDIHQSTIDEAAFEDVQHIIHLAGANISEKRWTDERKKELISSRVDSARLILDTLKKRISSLNHLFLHLASMYMVPKPQKKFIRKKMNPEMIS
ncbi:NAD-dependent epimerase/dehydratase family protein [Chryseobacterium daecheongense]|uniref:NAD-dependent epimerase/dehydratase family protein n=1 Tax=Chryseobacterium daecheongense TaxID=192389 RepID=UPI001FD66D96|nr:NAD-dependent epimerase/dehydratase family protein [Chryseobacterium daecheongense]UOU97319.1 NAD-dependent epimerase/dehydratase family protein [Chryseobacterium daecheongense]